MANCLAVYYLRFMALKDLIVSKKKCFLHKAQVQAPFLWQLGNKNLVVVGLAEKRTRGLTFPE
jgi:hypothetical protein